MADQPAAPETECVVCDESHDIDYIDYHDHHLHPQDAAIYIGEAHVAQPAAPETERLRLAFAIYTRCGDRSEARAMSDADAVLRWVAGNDDVPEWFRAAIEAGDGS